ATSRGPHSFPTRRSSDLFLRSGATWTPRGGVEPAWITGGTGFGRTWVFRSPTQWAINLRVPMFSVGAIDDNGIALADQFKLWFRSEEHTSELQSPYDLVC